MKRIFSHALLAAGAAAGLTLSFILPSPAAAAMSRWAESEGGRMRIVALPPDASGHIRAGLQIEPKPGWITYWREPGESGIPPQVAALPGGNVSLKAIAYPVPKHITAGPANDFGYDGPVTLPLSFAVAEHGKAAQIDAQAFIGVCKNICIPFQATFSLPVTGKGGSHAEEITILDAAAARLPEQPGADFSVAAFALTPDLGRLQVQLKLPGGAHDADIIVTGPAGYVFTRQDKARPVEGGLSTEIVLPQLPRNYAPRGKQWRILVKSGARAMETVLAFR